MSGQFDVISGIPSSFYWLIRAYPIDLSIFKNMSGSRSAGHSSKIVTCSKSTIEILKKVWNMFKVYNKNSRTTSVWWFTTFCSVSIVDFEQVNVSWVPPHLTYLFNIEQVDPLQREYEMHWNYSNWTLSIRNACFSFCSPKNGAWNKISDTFWYLTLF